MPVFCRLPGVGACACKEGFGKVGSVVAWLDSGSWVGRGRGVGIGSSGVGFGVGLSASDSGVGFGRQKPNRHKGSGEGDGLGIILPTELSPVGTEESPSGVGVGRQKPNRHKGSGEGDAFGIGSYGLGVGSGVGVGRQKPRKQIGAGEGVGLVWTAGSTVGSAGVTGISDSVAWGDGNKVLGVAEGEAIGFEVGRGLAEAEGCAVGFC